MIDDEYTLARQAVLAITERNELLEGTAWLQRSIRVRNPYVDPLNLIQCELMKRIAAKKDDAKDANDASDADTERLHSLLRHSVQGISGGMRTTG